MTTRILEFDVNSLDEPVRSAAEAMERGHPGGHLDVAEIDAGVTLWYFGPAHWYLIVNEEFTHSKRCPAWVKHLEGVRTVWVKQHPYDIGGPPEDDDPAA